MSVNCPNCQAEGRVKDSRPAGGDRLRRRVCDTCGTYWVTFEISEKEYKQLKEAAKTLRANVRVRRRKLVANPTLRIA